MTAAVLILAAVVVGASGLAPSARAFAPSPVFPRSGARNDARNARGCQTSPPSRPAVSRATVLNGGGGRSNGHNDTNDRGNGIHGENDIEIGATGSGWDRVPIAKIGGRNRLPVLEFGEADVDAIASMLVERPPTLRQTRGPAVAARAVHVAVDSAYADGSEAAGGGADRAGADAGPAAQSIGGWDTERFVAETLALAGIPSSRPSAPARPVEGTAEVDREASMSSEARREAAEAEALLQLAEAEAARWEEELSRVQAAIEDVVVGVDAAAAALAARREAAEAEALAREAEEEAARWEEKLAEVRAAAEKSEGASPAPTRSIEEDAGVRKEASSAEARREAAEAEEEAARWEETLAEVRAAIEDAVVDGGGRAAPARSLAPARSTEGGGEMADAPRREVDDVDRLGP